MTHPRPHSHAKPAHLALQIVLGMLPLPSMAVAAAGKAGHCISPTQGLHWDLAAGRPVPASLSNCRDNCHKSNCSCWITSIFASSSPAAETIISVAISGLESGSCGPEKARSGWIWAPEAKSHAEVPLTTVPVCQAALSLCSCCSECDELCLFWWCTWFSAMPLQAAGFATTSPRCSIRQMCSLLPGHAASQDHSKQHPLPPRNGLDEAGTWQNS